MRISDWGSDVCSSDLGWARYWARIHRFITDRLAASAELREASQIVRFEDLCREPAEKLHALFDHCRLGADAGLIADLAATIRFPGYYRPARSDERRVGKECVSTCRYRG